MHAKFCYIQYNKGTNNIIDRKSYDGISVWFQEGQFYKRSYILRTNQWERMIQHEKDLCIAFIDYTKAFNRVNGRDLTRDIEIGKGVRQGYKMRCT